MLLRKLIVFAVTSGLARKAWEHYRQPRRAVPVDITDVVARPVASADPAENRGRRRMGARRRKEGPSA